MHRSKAIRRALVRPSCMVEDREGVADARETCVVDHRYNPRIFNRVHQQRVIHFNMHIFDARNISRAEWQTARLLNGCSDHVRRASRTSSNSSTSRPSSSPALAVCFVKSIFVLNSLSNANRSWRVVARTSVRSISTLLAAIPGNRFFDRVSFLWRGEVWGHGAST